MLPDRLDSISTSAFVLEPWGCELLRITIDLGFPSTRAARKGDEILLCLDLGEARDNPQLPQDVEQARRMDQTRLCALRSC